MYIAKKLKQILYMVCVLLLASTLIGCKSTQDIITSHDLTQSSYEQEVDYLKTITSSQYNLKIYGNHIFRIKGFGTMYKDIEEGGKGYTNYYLTIYPTPTGLPITQEDVDQCISIRYVLANTENYYNYPENNEPITLIGRLCLIETNEIDENGDPYVEPIFMDSIIEEYHDASQGKLQIIDPNATNENDIIGYLN